MHMWLFTKFGFFSVVNKGDGDQLTVRSRTRGDLDCWRRPKIDPPCRLKIDPVQIADFSLSNCG